MATHWLDVGLIRDRISITDPSGGHANDLLLGRCRDFAESAVSRLAGIAVESTTYDEWYDIKSQCDSLYLYHWPVTAVSSLKYGTSSITIGTPTEYNAGTVSAYWNSSRIIYPPKFERGICNYRVGYTAGLVDADLDGEYRWVRDVAVAFAALAWRERDRWGDMGKSMETFRIDYTRDLPAAEKLLLRSGTDWRRLVTGRPVSA